MSFPQQSRAVVMDPVLPSQIILFPTSRKALESVDGPLEFNAYEDRRYLDCVIGCLKQARAKQNLNIQQVARRAGISRSIIARAEREGIIPKSVNFKAWAAALGYTWESLWTLNFPEPDHGYGKAVNQ